MLTRNTIIKSMYDWKALVIVIVLFFLIEFFTTPFGGGNSGFPFETCTHGSTIAFKSECSWSNITLNLTIYYVISVLIITLIKSKQIGEQ